MLLFQSVVCFIQSVVDVTSISCMCDFFDQLCLIFDQLCVLPNQLYMRLFRSVGFDIRSVRCFI